jgi:electron transfer flavoprotein beta subunit
LLDIPQITYAQGLTAGKDKVVAERNMGDTMVTTESPYPVLITVTKEINEPRLPSLMQILGSANKPIHDWNVDSLISGKLTPLVQTVELKGVSMERKNVVYQDDIGESVKQLVDSLAKEGVLR